jgi:CBS domain-containing protein
MSVLLKAEDIMTPEISYIDSSASIKDAALKMLNEGIGCLIVTREESPVGIVTKRDIIRAIVFEKRDPEKNSIAEIMSTPLITVEAHATIREILQAMFRNNISHLPVREEDKIIGIISDYDVAQALDEILDYIEALQIKEKKGEE